MKTKTLITSLAITVCSSVVSAKNAETVRAPSQIIAQASESSWRGLDLENTLLIELATGTAIVELNPTLAPGHVANIKLLAREGFYDGLNVYRFVEGFVAQGGDVSDKIPVKTAKKAIPAEFYHSTKVPFGITLVDDKDGYAARTGFINGFAVAQNQAGTQTWQAHCTGTFAMARGNEADSGGTEFYVVLGHATRYLDRNITAFGRVIDGMAHFQQLSREAKNGVEDVTYNPIKSVRVAADVEHQKSREIKVMKTESEDFKELIKARRNRPEAWFIETPNYTDVCAVSVPTK
jgi:cyclophilin family peptidyl-prolyl cis-trans isomerase